MTQEKKRKLYIIYVEIKTKQKQCVTYRYKIKELQNNLFILKAIIL